jgi:NADPH:quinone reductase-like Zn-dependent oxidoreductase
MASQTVFRLTSRESFDNLHAFKEPIPTISPHEILIKIRSIALNYRDIAIASSTYPLPVKGQVIPCSDMAGVVSQVGDLVSNYAEGDAVLAPINASLLYGTFSDKHAAETFGGLKDGVLREYITLEANTVVKLPKSSHSLTQWAALVTTGSTVWNAFYGNSPLKPGDTVLVLGMVPTCQSRLLADYL